MLYTNSTENLIGLQDLIIKKIETDEKEIHIYGQLKRKQHKCPCCRAETNKIHDYREQIIKDIPLYDKHAFSHLQKRRYRCECGKRFYESNSFLPRYYRRTNRLSMLLAGCRLLFLLMNSKEILTKRNTNALSQIPKTKSCWIYFPNVMKAI